MLATILASAAAVLGVASPLDDEHHATRVAALDATTKAAAAVLAESLRRARVIAEAAQIKHASTIEDAKARVARRTADLEAGDAGSFHEAFPRAFALWRVHRTDASPVASLVAETRAAVRLRLGAELDASALVVALAPFVIEGEDPLSAFGSHYLTGAVQIAQRFFDARGEVAACDALRACESALATVPHPFTTDRVGDPTARAACLRSRLVNVHAALTSFDTEHEAAVRAVLVAETVRERDKRFPNGFRASDRGLLPLTPSGLVLQPDGTVSR